MPIIKSAKKRVRVAQKASSRNRKTKRLLKSALKTFQSSVDKKDSKTADANHRAAQSAISKAAKKHVIHKNKAARKQRQLAAQAKKVAAAKPAAKKTTKPAAKKPVVRKTTTKK